MAYMDRFMFFTVVDFQFVCDRVGKHKLASRPITNLTLTVDQRFVLF